MSGALVGFPMTLYANIDRLGRLRNAFVRTETTLEGLLVATGSTKIGLVVPSVDCSA